MGQYVKLLEGVLKEYEMRSDAPAVGDEVYGAVDPNDPESYKEAPVTGSEDTLLHGARETFKQQLHHSQLAHEHGMASKAALEAGNHKKAAALLAQGREHMHQSLKHGKTIDTYLKKRGLSASQGLDLLKGKEAGAAPTTP
jgi:hypothetical protein